MPPPARTVAIDRPTYPYTRRPELAGAEWVAPVGGRFAYASSTTRHLYVGSRGRLEVPPSAHPRRARARRSRGVIADSSTGGPTGKQCVRPRFTPTCVGRTASARLLLLDSFPHHYIAALMNGRHRQACAPPGVSIALSCPTDGRHFWTNDNEKETRRFDNDTLVAVPLSFAYIRFSLCTSGAL